MRVIGLLKEGRVSHGACVGSDSNIYVFGGKG